MMKLSLMRDVFKTVNDDWDCAFASSVVSSWEHDGTWIKMWRASANFICVARHHDDSFILRFNRISEKDREDWESEVRLLQALKKEGLRVSQPIPDKDSRFVRTADTELGSFLSVLYKKVEGNQYDMEEMDDSMFFRWGAALGRLHKVANKVEKTAGINRKSHRELLEGLFSECPPADEREKKEYAWAKGWLESLDRTADNYGVIHYDFEPDNLIWDEEGIQLIDFDDSISSWYVADIAFALRDLFDEGDHIDLENGQFLKFMEGYRSEKDLSDDALDLLPGFYRLSNLTQMIKIGRSIDIDVSDAHPEWLNNLIVKLTAAKKECAHRMIAYQK